MATHFDVAMLSRHERDGRFLYASPAAERVLGRAPRELVGVALRSVVVPEDAPQLDQALAQAADSEDAVTVRCRVAGEHGGERWIEITSHAVRIEGGTDVTELHCVSRLASTPDADLAARLACAEQQVRRLESLLEDVPCVVWASWGLDAVHGQQTSYVNGAITTLTGYGPEDWLSRPMFWLELVHPEDRQRVQVENSALMTQGFTILEFRWVRSDGEPVWIESRTRLLRDERGNVTGMCGVSMDITPKKEAEAEARQRDEFIRAQERVLADLSTPLIPINARVIVMPLVGALDRGRAARVVEALLQGVSSSRAQVAIIDITGVPAVDVQIAEMLVRAARGVRLLGAKVILTGTRPEVAQTLVSLGIDLEGITTLGNLEAGLRHALPHGN